MRGLTHHVRCILNQPISSSGAGISEPWVLLQSALSSHSALKAEAADADTDTSAGTPLFLDDIWGLAKAILWYTAHCWRQHGVPPSFTPVALALFKVLPELCVCVRCAPEVDYHPPGTTVTILLGKFSSLCPFASSR